MSTGPKRPTLDVKTNLPVTFTLKYADWFKHAEYGEKLKAAVVIPSDLATPDYAAGEYTAFFFPGAEVMLADAGVIQELPKKNDERQFRVVNKAALVTLKQTEVRDETTNAKKKRTLLLVDGAVPASPPSARAAAVNRAADPPAEEGDAGTGARLPQPAPPPQADAEVEALARRKAMLAFDTVGEEYEVSLRLARRAFRRAGLENAEAAALHAAAATILIQIDRRGYRGYRGIARAFGDYLERSDPRGTRADAVASGATERALATTPARVAAPKKDPYLAPERIAAQPVLAGLEDRSFEERPAGLDDEEADDGLPF